MKIEMSKMNRTVFFSSTLVILLLLSFTLVAPEIASASFSFVQAKITTYGGWFYVLAVAVILALVIYLSVSKFGEIKLGPEHSEPDYSLSSWISMLFAAGMGIGLMFFGVAEPIMHFSSPPTAEKDSVEAIREAMEITFFHWGFHAWAIYAIVGLILSYFCYRKGLPLTLRSALHPIIGDRIYGWIGDLVDIFAVVGTVFGVATSLGLGAAQVNSGLAYLFSVEVNQVNQLLIMLVITAFASVSVATGLNKGIKILSESNMILAIVLLILVFVLGPTLFLIQAYVQNFGGYVSDIVSNTFNLFAYDKKDWLGGWTIFYWGWWLAWAPFVGLFIARISRGRTIREFMMGVLIVPTAFTLLWMTIFGNSAIHLLVEQGVDSIAVMINNNAAVGLFVFLENFPMSDVLIGLSIVMIVIFFVTSCDSGAMVIDMLCSNGRDDTPVTQRLFWAISVGLVGGILSLVGGLEALQTMTIVSALPFTIVLLIACVGLLKALQIEAAKQSSLQLVTLSTGDSDISGSWKERLSNMLSTPSRITVDQFLKVQVLSAFYKLQKEFEVNGLDAKITTSKTGYELTVFHGNEHDFVYAVHKKKHTQPDFNMSEHETYYRAEVHLTEGGQDYDIMDWSELDVVNDIIDQYQKHLHFLHLVRS